MRDLGFHCEVVERWNPHVRVRKDLFGIADILAVGHGLTIMVQTTSGSNLAARVKKIIAMRTFGLVWLGVSGHRIEVHGWAKHKMRRGGKAYRYKLNCREITIPQFLGGKDEDQEVRVQERVPG